MRINTNINAIMIRNELSSHNKSIDTSTERLSSGKRINRAADDAAGLAISERMTSDIKGSAQAIRNAIDGISFMQTAEGALSQINNMLQRSRELVLQGANGTNSAVNKAIIQQEVEQISMGIKDILRGTSFNNQDAFVDAASLEGKEALEFWLENSWIPESSRLIEDHFGLNAKGSRIELTYEGDGPGGASASVSWTTTVPASNLKLNIDLADFPLSGYPSGDGNTEQDRIIAHEVVHGVMAVNMNMSALPGWFTEGAAEIIHGADERVIGDIAGAGSISNLFTTANLAPAAVGSPGSGTNPNANPSRGYSVGYVAVKLLDQAIKDNGKSDGLKAMMADLQTKTSSGSLGAISDFEDSILSLTGASAFYTSVTSISTVADLQAANVNLSDSDTGSIHGSDYGNESKSALDVISNEAVADDPNDLQITGLSEATEQTQIGFQLGSTRASRIVMDKILVNVDAISVQGIEVTDPPDALEKLDLALKTVAEHQGRLGALQNRLGHSVNNLRVFNEQTSTERSVIVDADFAKETTSLSRSQVITQAAQAMLSQANSTPQQVLSLLQ